MQQKARRYGEEGEILRVLVRGPARRSSSLRYEDDDE